MNDSRIEVKVGLFVFAGIALIALLVLNFSRGVTLFGSTYELRVRLPNVVGLKPTADVLMAGVPIGKVDRTELAPDGEYVDIMVSILNKYDKIPTNAVFQIDSLSYLGDEYIKVSPPKETGLTPTGQMTYLKNGDTVIGESPLDFAEKIQSLSEQAQATMRDLDKAIVNLNKSALSTNTLSEVVLAVNNLTNVSARAVDVAEKLDVWLGSNSGPVNQAISNFQSLSVSLTNTAAELNTVVADNKEDVRTAITKLTDTSDKVNKIASDLQSGRGMLGELLKDQTMKVQLAQVISNADVLTAELSTFGSNLNRKGIWAMLWKPKHEDAGKSAGRAGRN